MQQIYTKSEPKQKQWKFLSTQTQLPPYAPYLGPYDVFLFPRMK